MIEEAFLIDATGDQLIFHSLSYEHTRIIDIQLDGPDRTNAYEDCRETLNKIHADDVLKLS